MAAPQELGQTKAPREKAAYFIRSGTQVELRDYLSEFCDPLLGADVFVSRTEGDIYYITWRDLPKERILPGGYVQISQAGPRADIYARYTRYAETRAMVFKRIKKEGGGVEVAIRAFDHILEGVRGKETRQAAAVQSRAYELLDLFQVRRLSEINPVEFRQAERETYALLQEVKLDPQKVVNQQKGRMIRWLLKGETGRDESPSRRLNWLISVGALSASYNTAVNRRLGLGPIAVKYVEGREALILARQFAREVFSEVVDRLRPEALPSHMIFLRLDRPTRQVMLVSGMINTMTHQLDRFIRVKPYKTVGQEVAQILREADLLTREGKSREARRLLISAHRKLVECLAQYKYVYPQEKIY